MDLDPKTWWYVTRASGFVSWALLAIAVLWGLFITNKTLHRSTAPAWVLDLHRHLGGLAVVFVAVHVGALPLDGYTHWGWTDLFVPMATTWHPGAIAWGIVGMYLLVAIEITSLLGRRFPKKWWRRVHMLSFPLYVLASIHLFAAGTDSDNQAVQFMVLTVSTLVVFLTIVRGLAAAKPRETRPNPRVAAAKARATRARTTATVPTVPAASANLRAPTLNDRVTKLRDGVQAASRRARDHVPSSVGSGPST
ncbi:MAG: ferric reductase-like transmembrane domain-containing protein [Acidimicrobiia bacterium]|nr:ferric reductase-like transmembrane domain-containing protein [Acidimicrobiia bacterium]